MPLRRRRDGSAARARTEEQSSGHVRVPLRWKAPRSIRGWRSSRGDTQGGSRPGQGGAKAPGFAASWLGDPGARSVSRRARATSFKERALPLLACSGPRPVFPRKWSAASVEPPRAGCGSPAVDAATRRKGQRSRDRLVPAGRRVKALLAWGDRRLVGCARASLHVAEVGKRRPGSEKRGFPLATGPRAREPRPSDSERGRAASKASRVVIAVAKPWRRRRPEPDVREDVAGQRFLSDERHLGSVVPRASLTRTRGPGLRRLPQRRVRASATADREKRQGCQRLGTHARRWRG